MHVNCPHHPHRDKVFSYIELRVPCEKGDTTPELGDASMAGEVLSGCTQTEASIQIKLLLRGIASIRGRHACRCSTGVLYAAHGLLSHLQMLDTGHWYQSCY